ncbi:hypothetical protein [Aeromicrobium massiliense]|uniref:hypothetical protein n=1 Tax=Aeromicrobium massiliense TaxID=1464554 RepID=UPI0002DF95D2|nr:hypothetical protein [Aeromicrobium massiliense]
MRRPFFALPLLLALVVGALAGPSTTATAADETGTISGTVTLAGGDVTDVEVLIIRSAESSAIAATRPDGQGRWSIAVPKGTYRVLFAGGRSVVRQHWGGQDPAAVVVIPGGAVTGIDASITLGGSIVVECAPQQGSLQVQLLRRESDSWLPTRHTFLIDQSPWWAPFHGLEPGTYRLHLEAMPGRNARGQRSEGVTPVPVDQDQDIVVKPGSIQSVEVDVPMSAGLIQPIVHPSVSEPRYDGTFELRLGTWAEGTTVLDQQWYSGTSTMHPVDGAPGRIFSAGSQHHGHRVAARTVVRRAGHPDTVHWSETQRVSEPLDRDVAVTLGRTTADVETGARLAGEWINGQYVVYQWFLDGKLMESNSYGRYLPPRTSVGRTLRVRVTQDLEGRRIAAETSVVVGATARRLVSRPRVLRARVGQAPAVHDIFRTWTPTPFVAGSDDYRFRTQWYLDGKPLANPPGRLSWRLAGRSLRARVTLTQVGYRPVAVETATVRVQLANMVRSLAAPPAIDNQKQLQVGDTARVSKGRWSPRPTRVRYQWYAGNRAIKGATKSRLKITQRLAGVRIRVKVTVGHTGYRTATAWSRTARVSG